MPMFKVKFSDGSTRYLQAHSKEQLQMALGQVKLQSIKKEPATKLTEKERN